MARKKKIYDLIYEKTQREIQKEYNDALERAIRKNKEFLKRAQDVQSGRIKPPASYKTQRQIDAWKRGYLKRASAKQKIVEGISEEMRISGIRCRKKIKNAMVRMYGENSKATLAILDKSGKFNMTASTDAKIRALLEKRSTSFEKVAFKDMGETGRIRQKLRDELAAAIQNNESRDKMVKRIQGVVEMDENRAKRILQTETTRIEGEAQYDACKEFYEKNGGAKPRKRWICTFQNSRDTHVALHNSVVDFDEPFDNGLMFPGDPNGPASEVVNCRCRLEIIEG